MPLTRLSCKPYYEDALASDDVIDKVVWGRSEYPVIDLCNSGEYELANILLQKGYRCLHEDAAHDALTILRSIHLHNVLFEKEEQAGFFLLVLNELAAELNQLNESDYRLLVNDLVRSIAENRYCNSHWNIIADIRKNLPELYTALLEYGDFAPCILMMLDADFVQDYLEELSVANRIDAYIVANRVRLDKDIYKLLLDLMSVNYMDEVELPERNLYHINKMCPGIFPTNFTCDVVILAAIGKMRVMTQNLEEWEPKPGDPLFELFPSFVGQLNRLLRFHMKEDFSFDRVAEALIVSCAASGIEYSLEELEIPQPCDYYILEEVASYARQNFSIDKLPVSDVVLESATTFWKDRHSDPEWEYDFNIAMPEIEKLTEWFYENCICSEYPEPWEESNHFF